METITNEIVKIKASDYGLDETKAAELTKNLPQIITERDVFVTQFDEVIRLNINDPDTAKKARELRLRIRDNRTKGIEIWHRTTKDFFLKGGQFVDAIKRMEVAVNERMETDLEKIEKYQENLEHERTEKLRVDRLALIKQYTDIEPMALGHMEQAVFDNLLQGFKIAYETRIAAEKKAEEDRIAKEKADAEEREKQRLENIRLKKEAEERERLAEIERETKSKRQKELKGYIIFIRDYNKMITLPENEYQKEFKDIQWAAKEHYEYEAKEKQKKQKEHNELLAKAERERIRRENIEAEVKRKKEADDKIKRDAELKLLAEKKAPDKTKLLNFMQSINDLPRPEIKSIEAASIMGNANAMLIQAANYIRDNANKL